MAVPKTARDRTAESDGVSSTAGGDDRAATVERRSPPTERVIAVLTALADRSGDGLGLSEVARRAEASKPTCLGILNTLVEFGLAHRNADKTYRLGPTMLQLGWSAEFSVAQLDLIRPHLRTLHRSTRIGWILSAHDDGETVVADRSGIRLSGDRLDLLGQRYPAVPPLGLHTFAWQSDQLLEAWLDQAPLVDIAAPRTVLDAIVSRARADGFLVEWLTPPRATLNTVLANVVASRRPHLLLGTVAEFLPPAEWREFLAGGDDDSRSITAIHAPIFDRHGEVRYTVSVLPSPPPVTPTTRRAWTARLLTATRAATDALGGWDPWQ